ncbi:MAG: transcriptional repressor LexA [Actinomycetota bacterium]|nr:transcriptional repressor LexA [Actinomycetota bacterium]MDQ5814769.1 transcriptional repressor LexA [Actinomycetota bacterium]
MVEGLTDRQRQTLSYIAETVGGRGYPPSVREICEALGLASSSTVHSHLQALQRKGYISIDPTKPRAIELHFDTDTGLAADRRPTRSVPLLGRIAAGTPIMAEENVEEIYPMPADLVGDGNIFMLEVAGESMIDAGIYDGDFVIVRQQPTAHSGEIVAAMIPSEYSDTPEATVKTIRHRGSAIVLEPANETMEPFEAPPGTEILGKIVGIFRQL